MRGVAIMEQETIKWTDLPTTQHVHSHLMRRCCMGAHTGPAGISSFHTVVTAGFTAQQQWWRFATGYRRCDKQEKWGTS